MEDSIEFIETQRIVKRTYVPKTEEGNYSVVHEKVERFHPDNFTTNLIEIYEYEKGMKKPTKIGAFHNGRETLSYRVPNNVLSILHKSDLPPEVKAYLPLEKRVVDSQQ